MLKQRLNQLFINYSPNIQILISEVLNVEQAHISMDRPHVKDQIDQIVSRLATKELEQVEDENGPSRSLLDEI